MFSTTEHISRATRDLFDTQAAFVSTSIQAMMDAGLTAAELNSDALKTLLASATVATRQWLNANACYDWFNPPSVKPADATDPGTPARMLQ